MMEEKQQHLQKLDMDVSNLKCKLEMYSKDAFEAVLKEKAIEESLYTLGYQVEQGFDKDFKELSEGKSEEWKDTFKTGFLYAIERIKKETDKIDGKYVREYLKESEKLSHEVSCNN